METKVVKIHALKPEKALLKEAATIIKKGGLVAFPTETVYGLAADYLNEKAIRRLCEVKKRPEGKPFTVHIADFDQLDKLSCELNIFSKNLIKKFWPGPLTLIFKTKSGEKVGARMPSNRIAREFILACENPIVAPSANISGNKPPRSKEEVLRDLDGKIDLLLDGGETEMGIESTVVDVSNFPYRILRKGAISDSQIADAGRELEHI